MDFDTRDRADARQAPLRFDGERWHYSTGSMDRIRFMVRAQGYVMVRKPRAAPFILSEKEWLALPLFAQPQADREG